MSRIPLLTITVPFVLGILAYYGAGQTGLLFAGLSVCVAVAGVVLRLYKTLVVILFAGMAGYMVAMLRSPNSLPAEIGGDRLYSGVIEAETERGSMRIMEVRIDSCGGTPSPTFTVKAILPTLGIAVEECDRIRFVADIKPLSHSCDLPDEIDYNASMARRGVVGECYVVPDSVKGVTAEAGWLNEVRRWRCDVAASLAVGTLSAEASDFLIAALAGERDILSRAHRDLFSSAGLAHLLALSGLHVGIIAFVLSMVLFPLSLLGMRWLAGGLTVLVLGMFAVMTGLSPSVSRAVIMCSVFILTFLLQREWSPVNALCLAAVIILTVTPYAVFSIGFQLSFVAVVSIIVFSEKLNPFIDERGSIRRWGMMLVTVPVAAMLGTGIVTMFHFNSFPVYFLPGNIVVSFVIPVLLGGGVVKAFVGLAGFPTGWIDGVLDFLYGILHGVSERVSELPGAVVTGVYIESRVVVAYFFALALFALWLHRRRVVYLLAAVAVGIFTLLLPVMVGGRCLGEDELYVTRSHSETTAVMSHGDRLMCYTTAHPSMLRSVMARDSSRYSLYKLRRWLSGPDVLADGYHGDGLARIDNVVSFHGTRLQFVSSGRQYLVDSLHYLVVCRGVRGDIVSLASRLRPDSVMLSSDLTLRRHDRYCAELANAGIPYRSLRSSPLVLKAARRHCGQ